MAQASFRLTARVSTDSPERIRHVLRDLFPEGLVQEATDGFVVEAVLRGPSAKELNRTTLSALRRTEKKTRLRAEWTAEDGSVYRFFDYVLKGTRTLPGPD